MRSQAPTRATGVAAFILYNPPVTLLLRNLRAPCASISRFKPEFDQQLVVIDQDAYFAQKLPIMYGNGVLNHQRLVKE
ncbi:MAG: hypothetical protein JO076_04545 [Verrucomicrobia bacterium]|nr:hypothetical protein [Verrucomicrobiota bacterium]